MKKVCCYLMAAMFLPACCQSAESAVEPLAVRAMIPVVRVVKADAHEYPFIVRPYHETDLSFRVGGTLTGVKLEPGQFFRRGDIVLSIDSRDFIVRETRAAALLQDAEQAKAARQAAIAAKEEAETELMFVEGENKAKEQYRLSLDSEIAEREQQLKDERKSKVDSILDSVGSLVGVGKSAAVGKENAKLKAENERMKKAFAEAVKDKAEERAKALTAEKQKAEAERDRALVQSRSLAIERDKAVRQLQEQKDSERQRISQAVSQATAEKDKTIRLLQSTLKASRHILSLFADMLYKASEVFRRAIDAIIHFGTEQHKSFFAPSEAADIKSVMQEYGETTEQQKAIGAWLCDYAESRQPFDEIKHRHTLKEVGDVADGRYDWKIERMQGNGISK